MRGGQVTLALGATVRQFAELSPFPQNDPALDRASCAPGGRQGVRRGRGRGRPGQRQAALLCVEAMKMEMWLRLRQRHRLGPARPDQDSVAMRQHARRNRHHRGP